jgi:putative NIF3 family GTP cyclohydrolase 1 type 2
VIFPDWLQNNIIKVMKDNHPYEEVAHDVYNLDNHNQEVGSGIIGALAQPINEADFLEQLATVFKLKMIKHTLLKNLPCKKIAICGGAGSFLINSAKVAGADVFITSDVKYHEFFDADEQMLLIDIGHYESEQFTIELLIDLLSNKFPNFAIQKTGVNTNPVQYFVSKNI